MREPAGAAQRVADAEALVSAVEALFRDPSQRDAMREAAGAFHAAHRGATERLMHWLGPQLEGRVVNRSDRG